MSDSITVTSKPQSLEERERWLLDIKVNEEKRLELLLPEDEYTHLPYGWCDDGA